MGLLPNLASDLLPKLWAVSHEKANAQAGWLISAYALGVVVGAPTIAALAARFPRKQLLLACVGVFTLGTIASAVLPTFGLILVARFVAALPHGAYFGIAALVAASLMGPGKRGRGVALVLSGLTIANVIGVPAITYLGQHAGWRMAYLAVAVVFALAFLAIRLVVPLQAGDARATMRRELTAFHQPQVWLTLLVGALGFGGLFAVYTYISPVVTNVTGLDPGRVPLVLVAMGLGMTVGNFAGGRPPCVGRSVRVLRAVRGIPPRLCVDGAVARRAVRVRLPGGGIGSGPVASNSDSADGRRGRQPSPRSGHQPFGAEPRQQPGRAPRWSHDRCGTGVPLTDLGRSPTLCAGGRVGDRQRRPAAPFAAGRLGAGRLRSGGRCPTRPGCRLRSPSCVGRPSCPRRSRRPGTSRECV